LTVFWRYWLLQIPGWGVLIALLVGAHHWLSLSLLACVLVFIAWLVKDLLFYPILKPHYDFKEREAHTWLLGETAVAEEPLGPRGYVKLRGELWMAELSVGEPEVPKGETVRVEAVHGLTLEVRR
jgi:membrane protein implicated in regulation of membrane protease activity